ncbi:hypothetical protein BpHYR1_011835, partial [Brachionus plicatilis]
VVLEDHGDVLNNKVKRQAVEFLKKQKENLEQIFTTAVQNRDIVMDKAKIRHDRLIHLKSTLVQLNNIWDTIRIVKVNRNN